MARDIKFRAYCSLTKEMINDYCICNGVTFEGYDLTNNSHYITGVMQYSGLKDRNGKEIYEGDIIQTRYKDKSEPTGEAITVNECAFRGGAFGWFGEITGNFFCFLTDSLDEGEVIGNIYQNPELLENNGA